MNECSFMFPLGVDAVKGGGRLNELRYHDLPFEEVSVETIEGATAQEIRIKAYNSHREIFASAPIRLMSSTVSTMQSMGYNDLPTAIGDLDWRTVPADDAEDPELRGDWRRLLESAFSEVDRWLDRVDDKPMGYNLASIGYPAVTRSWAGMWSRQLGIEFENRPQSPPELIVFHGGNQAVQAALLGVAEAHREREGCTGRPTVLVPIPSFSCPLAQIALQGMQALLLPPEDPGMDPSAEDLDRIPDGTNIDGVYLMPVNNPTGRTVPPERLRAFLEAVLDRWPHAGIILDSVYVRLHPRYRELLAWYDDDPRFSRSVLLIDSLSKTHGVTGLRSGAVLTRSEHLRDGILRYAQNVMAGPSNAMQAVALALLAPFADGDAALVDERINLKIRIGRHLQRRRRLLLHEIFASHAELLDTVQPLLPDPEDFDWEGSMYADLQLSDRCHELAALHGVSPTVAFYLETGIGGVPLDGFCRNPNLERHGLLVDEGDPRLAKFLERATRFVRLSFGMTPPPGSSD
jgi:aspartate/methionine/tyrosine aminotransferase